MNFAYVTGNVQRDARMSEGPKTKVAHFTVASRQGENRTNYIPVVCFGRTAEDAMGLSRGDAVEVRGYLQSGSYEKDGEKVYTFELRAVRIIPAPPREDRGDRPPRPPKKAKGQGRRPAPKKGGRPPSQKRPSGLSEEDEGLLSPDAGIDDIF